MLRIAFNCHRNSPQLVLVAATRQNPDVRNVYYLPSPQEPWQTLITDTLCTSSAEPILPRDAVYLSTSDKGLFKIARNGGIYKNVGPREDGDWASIGSTWGATADSELYYAYHPKKLGLLFFTTEQLDPAPADEDQPDQPTVPAPATPHATPYTRQSQGLFTGPLVLEGAEVQANANGTVFYAVVNKLLYVGRRMTNSVLVGDVSVDPPFQELKPDVVQDAFHNIDEALDAFSSDPDVVQAARQLEGRLQEENDALGVQRITVTAKIAHAEGHPPKSVSVDLSRLGLSRRCPLLPAGRPAEAASGEAVYANTFSFDSLNLKNNPEDWRNSWTGIHGLTVSAVADDGSLAGAVGILGIPAAARGECAILLRVSAGTRDGQCERGQLPSPEPPPEPPCEPAPGPCQGPIRQPPAADPRPRCGPLERSPERSPGRAGPVGLLRHIVLCFARTAIWPTTCPSRSAIIPPTPSRPPPILSS